MTTRAFLPLYALLLLLAGCATRISEPVSLGQGVYMMLGSAFGLTTTSSDVVSDVERRASGFCASSGDIWMTEGPPCAAEYERYSLPAAVAG